MKLYSRLFVVLGLLQFMVSAAYSDTSASSPASTKENIGMGICFKLKITQAFFASIRSDLQALDAYAQDLEQAKQRDPKIQYGYFALIMMDYKLKNLNTNLQDLQKEIVNSQEVLNAYQLPNSTKCKMEQVTYSISGLMELNQNLLASNQASSTNIEKKLKFLFSVFPKPLPANTKM